MLCYNVCAHAASPRHRSLAMGRMRHTPSRPVRPSELLFYTLCILYQYAALALLPVALERVCCTHAKSGRGSSRRVLYGRVLSLCRRVRMEMAATHNTYLREYLERVSAYRGLQGGWLVGWLVEGELLGGERVVLSSVARLLWNHLHSPTANTRCGCHRVTGRGGRIPDLISYHTPHTLRRLTATSRS